MSNIKTAVICRKYQDFVWFITHFHKAREKYIWIDRPETTYGHYFNGYTIVGEDKARTFDWYGSTWEQFHDMSNYIREERDWEDELIWLIEAHRKMTYKETLDYLDEKGKVLCWLIEGYGQTGLPLSAVDYLSVERICELYNVTPQYFEKYGRK